MKTLLSVALAATLALAAVETRADGQPVERQVAFQIEPKTLADALNQWAAQSGFQLFSKDWQIAERLSAPRLTGTFGAQAALERLLAGTPLTYQWLSERAVSIRARVESQSTDGGATRSDAESARVRLAYLDEARDGFRVRAQPPAGRGELPSELASRDGIDEIIVTGTYIRGVAPDSSPVVVYDREDIEVSGVSSLDQFARERMPQNFASVDSGAGASTGAGGFNQGGNNRARGAAFNLHGLGPGATLTLVNGRRISSGGASGEFVDISLIPLAAVERIEVLTDGASALYGADAVAGVVNIRLRDDFDGAQTMLKYGEASRGGADEFSASQLLGHSWGRGNAMFVYEHNSQDDLLATDRGFIPRQDGIVTVWPAQTRNSALMNVRQEVGEEWTLSADALFSEREYELLTTPLGASFTVDSEGHARQYGGGLTLARTMGRDWRATLMGSYSTTEQPQMSVFPSFTNPDGSAIERGTIDTERTAAEIRADGSLLALVAGQVKLAMGASFASEKLDDSSSFIDSGVLQSSSSVALDRKISSAYAELFIPIVGAGNSRTQRLELSLAGRYDDYDDFGSSSTPKAGLLWSPVSGLNLRGTWGKSFKPPLLPDLIDRPAYFVFDMPDPNAADGVTTTLTNSSIGNPLLNPERSESLTFGIDWRPVPDLAVGLTYFDVDFTERVARPPIVGSSIFGIHSQRDTLAPFFDLSPDPQEIADLFARGVVLDTTGLGPAGVEVSFDFRPANIAAMKQTGLDFQARYERSTAGGEFAVSFGASHLLENEYAALAGGSTVSLLDLIGQPVDTRLNSSIGWSRSSLQAVLSLSYWGAYRDTLALQEGKVDSWTTADILLTYSTGPSAFARLESGFNFALALRNVTDESPPVATTNVGYDAANASPLGRFISLSVTKNW